MSDEYARFRRVLADAPLPAMLVDLDAVDHNLRVLLRGMGARSITMRLASKSIRCVAVLQYLTTHGEGRVRGVMPPTVQEAAFLAEQGLDDLLVAYPILHPKSTALFAALVERGVNVVAMADAAEQIEALAAAGRARQVDVPVCLDVDVSWRLLGGRVHLGVRRSPLRESTSVLQLARLIARTDGVILRGLMAYEAQVAGLPDASATDAWMNPLRRLIRSRSAALAVDRRAHVVDALRADGHETLLVNGGGTGSIHTTSQDESVTEVTAGSGFYCSHLFDGYGELDLRPAAFFALEVTRSSDPGFITAASGGFVASGAIGADRLPMIHLPPGLSPLGIEGWGEVQTPFRVASGASTPELGSPIIARHAKAGELGERFNTTILFRGDQVVDEVPTYRGQGQCFG